MHKKECALAKPRSHNNTEQEVESADHLCICKLPVGVSKKGINDCVQDILDSSNLHRQDN